MAAPSPKPKAVAASTRDDGGFFAQRAAVFQRHAGETAICAVMFSTLTLARFPTAAHETANLLNRAAGLPPVALPTEDGKPKPAMRRAP